MHTDCEKKQKLNEVSTTDGEIHEYFIFGRPFVKRFAIAIEALSVQSCLSVTLVYCGQKVGWIKVKLGKEVGLGPSHIMLDGDPAPPPKRGTAPHFGPCLSWPNGWMNQDATWYGGRPQHRKKGTTGLKYNGLPYYIRRP